MDIWFIFDIFVSFRTGYVHEGHFVSDNWKVAKAYIRGTFFIDMLGSFPLNLFLMLANPDNPYGDLYEVGMGIPAASGSEGGIDPGRANRMLRLLRIAKFAKLARMAKLAKYVRIPARAAARAAARPHRRVLPAPCVAGMRPTRWTSRWWCSGASRRA